MKPGTMEDTLGKRLTIIRKLQAKLDQVQFSEEMGVGVATIRRYENDERSPDTDFLVRLIEKWPVDPAWLLLGVHTESPHESDVGTSKRFAPELELVATLLTHMNPPGVLTVTYELKNAEDEVACPKCAEKIKAAAIVCRFCGNELAA